LSDCAWKDNSNEPLVEAITDHLLRSDIGQDSYVDLAELHDNAVWVSNTDQGTIVKIPVRADASAGPVRTVVTGLVGEVDGFKVLGRDDSILAALNPSSQVVLIRPGSQPQAVLTAADGLSNPTDVAVRGDALYVTNAAYFTRKNPNLLVGRLACGPSRGERGACPA